DREQRGRIPAGAALATAQIAGIERVEEPAGGDVARGDVLVCRPTKDVAEGVALERRRDRHRDRAEHLIENLRRGAGVYRPTGKALEEHQPPREKIRAR